MGKIIAQKKWSCLLLASSISTRSIFNRAQFLYFWLWMRLQAGLYTSSSSGNEAQPTRQSIKYLYIKQSLCQKFFNSHNRYFYVHNTLLQKKLTRY
jgi:hypothetical protein